MKGLWLVAVVVAGALAGGCKKDNGAACRQVRDLINHSSETVADSPDISGSPDEIAKAAAASALAMQAARDELADAKVDDGTLRTALADLEAVLDHKAQLLNQAAEAGAKSDEDAYHTIGKQLEAADGDEDAVTDRIKSYCHL